MSSVVGEVLRDWWASAHEISITKGVVNSTDVWEDLSEFVLPWCWVSSLLPREFVVPLILHQMWECERSHLEQIILNILLSISNFLNLFSNAHERPDESIELVDILGLGGLDHEATDDGPGLGWGVEAVVDESLGDIFLSHSEFLELIAVNDELVSASALFSSVKYLVRSIKLVGHVVGI